MESARGEIYSGPPLPCWRVSLAVDYYSRSPELLSIGPRILPSGIPRSVNFRSVYFISNHLSNWPFVNIYRCS